MVAEKMHKTSHILVFFCGCHDQSTAQGQSQPIHTDPRANHFFFIFFLLRRDKCRFFPSMSPPHWWNPISWLQLLDTLRYAILNKIMEHMALLHEQHIHITTIQETELTPSNITPSFPGLPIHDQPKSRQRGALITLVHKDIPFTTTMTEDTCC